MQATISVIHIYLYIYIYTYIILCTCHIAVLQSSHVSGGDAVVRQVANSPAASPRGERLICYITINSNGIAV